MRRKRAVYESSLRRSNAAYLARLREIDDVACGAESAAPSSWNIGLGQSEFLGLSRAGKYPDNYFVVVVYGIPTEESLRREDQHWTSLSSVEMLGSITSILAMRFRSRGDQMSWGGQGSFEFDDLQSLQSFLEPLEIEWRTAVDSYELLLLGGWSPDWDE